MGILFADKNWIKDYQKANIKDMLIKLAKLDKELSEKRDKARYVLKDIRVRKIITEYGAITFYRRRYIDLKNKKYTYLLDKYFALEKYTRILPSLKDKILNCVGSGKRYKDILDTLSFANISETTIGRVFNSIDNSSKLLDIKNKTKLNNNQNLYINMDDGYIKYRMQNKVYKLSVRVVSFNTGVIYKESNSKTRRRGILQNKKVFYMIGNKESPIKWQDTINKIIFWGNKYFENFEKAKLVIGGDGAKWVKKIAKEMNAEFHLDRFHGIKYLKDLFVRGKNKYDSNNWVLYKSSVDLFKNGKANELLEFLKECNFNVPKQVTNYFTYNKDGIIPQSGDQYIGVSAETDICNVLKAPLGFKKATYTLRNVVNFLSQRVFEINNGLKFNH